MIAKIEWYQEILEMEPSSKVFFPLAKLLVSINDKATAIATLQTGLEHHPDFLEARLFLIELAQDSLDLTHEVQKIGRLLETYPAFMESWARTCSVKNDDLALCMRFMAAALRQPDLSLRDIWLNGLDQTTGVKQQTTVMIESLAVEPTPEFELQSDNAMSVSPVPELEFIVSDEDRVDDELSLGELTFEESIVEPMQLEELKVEGIEGVEGSELEELQATEVQFAEQVVEEQSVVEQEIQETEQVAETISLDASDLEKQFIEKQIIIEQIAEEQSSEEQSVAEQFVAEQTIIDSIEKVVEGQAVAGQIAEQVIEQTAGQIAEQVIEQTAGQIAEQVIKQTVEQVIEQTAEQLTLEEQLTAESDQSPETIPAKKVNLQKTDYFDLNNEQALSVYSVRTKSLAEVLASQGDIATAVEIYEELAKTASKPEDVTALQKRISELKAMGTKAASQASHLNMLEMLASRLEARAHV